MNNDYNIVYEPSLKANTEKTEDLVADNIEGMSNNPVYKAVIPQYMYKPYWGYPRYQPLAFLRQIGKNVYASSVMKAVKDLIIDTEWDIVLKEGVEMTDELKTERLRIIEFIKKPNPDEEYDDFTRKWLDDAFKYDSGIINKVFNPLGEMLQLRVADGATFKKNPDKHGYFDRRTDIIYDKTEAAGTVPVSNANEVANSFSSIFSDTAAYFQYVNNVASQIPIPFGKREIIWVSFNPSSDNVYTNNSYLEDSIDLLLSLVYGVKYNLDFYQNGNTPEGIINAVGATKKDLKKIKSQLNHSIRTPKDGFGMSRRVGFRMPVVNMDNIDFVKLNLSSQEMEIIEQQKWFTKVFFMRFGLNADEMGFTDDSNRATSTQQTKNARKKALAPIFQKIANMYNYHVVPEFEFGKFFDFKFDFYDVIEQKLLRELQELEINMGINSPQMIADDEGIDFEKIKKDKEENMSFEFSDDNIQGDKEEIPQEEKDESNLIEEKKEAKSMGAMTGGEGTQDHVMNPNNNHNIELKPFGGYSNFQDCVSKNSDKGDPEAYCATIMRKVEGKSTNEYKSKLRELPKKTATETVLDDFSKEYDKMIRDVIKKA